MDPDRIATLRLDHVEGALELRAAVPLDLKPEEFGFVAQGAYDIISKLTGHPCMSGRIKFVVEDNFLDQITKVDLRSGQRF